MFCKVHHKCHEEGPLSKDVFRQGIPTDNNAARSHGSVVSITGTAGDPAIFNFMEKKFDAERKAAQKIKWENVLSKFCAEYPSMEIYAQTNSSFDMPDKMFSELPSELKWEFVKVHAVHLTEDAQRNIMANFSFKFAGNDDLKAASYAANSYVNLFPYDGPFMICVIVVALWVAYSAS
jgi:hypothetical protein